jgi:hypothetical protein
VSDIDSADVAVENSMTYSEWQGRNYREEMRARCVDQAIRIAAYGPTDVFGTAKALEAYIFGEQP